MKAYALIKIQRSKDYYSVSERILKIKGVIKADKVFGPWDYVAKFEGAAKEEISRIRDEIIGSGDIREVLTIILYPKNHI